MSTAEHAHEGRNAHEDGEHKVDPLGLYLGIFAALIILTAITVAASYVDFGAANTAIAVIIASTKAALVAIFFMHLRHDKPFHTLVLLSGLFFLSFLFLFTLTDEGSRGDVDGINGQLVEKTAPAETEGAAPAASGSAAPAPAPAHHLQNDGSETTARCSSEHAGRSHFSVRTGDRASRRRRRR